jgi:outer membrane lipoprotein-sorting protein
MIPERRIPRIARWGVPAGAVALTGIVAVGYSVVGAQAAPSLPSRTTVQLLAAVGSARVPGPMTATIQESASLGIPDLPSSGDPLSALSWLSGSHTVKIWYADPAHLRIEVPVQLGESDVRRDGRNVWYWNSQANQATHLVLPAQAAGSAQDGNSANGFTAIAPTPQQVAKQLLTAVGPTTKVGLQQNVTIAGQPAYQISLAPKASGSLIGQIRIAIDAQRAMPLRVQIFAHGASSPAFQVGFTSLQFGKPAAANFAFSPPAGAKVRTVTAPSGAAGQAQVKLKRLRAAAILRSLALQRALKSLPDGTHVPVPVPAPPTAAQLRIMRRAFVASLPKGLTAAQRQAELRKFDALVMRARNQKVIVVDPATGKPVAAPTSGSAFSASGAIPPGLGAAAGLGRPFGPFGGAAPTVLGKAWLTVLAFSTNSTAVSQSQLVIPSKIVRIGRGKVAAIPAGSAIRLQVGSSVAASGSAAASRSAAQVRGPVMVPLIAGSGPPGRDFAMLGALLRAATAVHGSWGSGRLLTTSLISVLITNNGKVLIGAVTPAVLYADAAHLK